MSGCARTIDAIAVELTEDDLVLRYRNEEGLNADGLTGEQRHVRDLLLLAGLGARQGRGGRSCRGPVRQARRLRERPWPPGPRRSTPPMASSSATSPGVQPHRADHRGGEIERHAWRGHDHGLPEDPRVRVTAPSSRRSIGSRATGASAPPKRSPPSARHAVSLQSRGRRRRWGTRSTCGGPTGPVASVAVATDKARTAAIYRRPSKDFEEQAAGRRASALHLARAVPLRGHPARPR